MGWDIQRVIRLSDYLGSDPFVHCATAMDGVPMELANEQVSELPTGGPARDVIRLVEAIPKVECSDRRTVSSMTTSGAAQHGDTDADVNGERDVTKSQFA